MNTNLYRLVYCSRNLLTGTPSDVSEELRNILAKARRNNSREQITGALLYNSGNFAQVLEGRLESIERVFEKIQCDPRHSEVTVIHSGPTDKLEFPEWAMAFAGSAADDHIPQATEAFRAAFEKSEGATDAILGMLRELVVQEDDWVLLA